MSKKRIDPNQLCFDFDRHIEEYRGLKETLLACNNKDAAPRIENWEEGCIEQAAAIKKAIRQSNMSREQVVDAINDYFGWPRADAGKVRALEQLLDSPLKRLTLQDFDYSKPAPDKETRPRQKRRSRAVRR